jgi:ketosteroid isomerase-like protein
MSDREVVRAWIEAAQNARASGLDEDFTALKDHLHADVEIKLASGWGDEPWRVAHETSDSVVARLKEAINAGSNLSTQTENLVLAGGDVLVEQLSVLQGPFGPRQTMIAHLFTVRDGRIAAIRTYRNDANLPG